MMFSFIYMSHIAFVGVLWVCIFLVGVCVCEEKLFLSKM